MTLRDQVADRISGGRLSELATEQEQLSNEVWRLKESTTRLEQALYSDDWRRIGMQADLEFSRDGVREITRLARIMKIKNPVIGRRVEVQRLYVWAQGVTVQVEEPAIQEEVARFLDDERNRAAVFGHQARGELEEHLQTDGKIFLRLFPDAQSGRVRVRVIDPLEIDEIVCNPDDASEPWYYRRTYTKTALDGTQQTLTEYYPDIYYNPRNKLSTLAASAFDGKIVWNSPVYHVRVNPMGRWGVSELYASLDWALAYKRFLENLASVWQALARWAMKLTVKGGASGVSAAKSTFGTTLDSGTAESNPPPLAGSMFIQADGAGDLQPFRTAGATMSAEDGRRLFLMAIAAGGYPETFYGDVSVGTLATAESLDRPTELKIADRQALWADVYRDLVGYALLWAVKAGQLSSAGRVRKERDGDEWREEVEWNDDVNGRVKVDFPPIIDIDQAQQIGALVDATTLRGAPAAGTFDLKTFTRRAAQVLGFDDVDTLVEELFPEDEEDGPDAPMTPEEEEDVAAEERRIFTQAVETMVKEVQEALHNGNV